MTALGVLTLSVWFVAEGTQLFSRDLPTPHHEQQEELPVITVCPQGPPVCQFAKIQEAINAAPDPESPYWEPTAEIRVASGTYEENLQLIHKAVLLKGTGKDQVFLRPAHKHQPTILFVGAIGGAGALIEGVTIDGIVALAGGVSGAHIRGTRLRGMIFITGSVSSGLFEENEFQGNELCGLGAIGVGRIQILRNTFQDGCAIRIEQARLYIPGVGPFQQAGDRVLIEGNQGGEISIWDGSAIAIRKNVVYDITLRKVESALIEENEVRHGRGIEVEGSTDVVIQKNVIEENYYGISVMGGYADRRTSVAILGNRVVRNNYGIVTESLEYVPVCQGNEVKENQAGDYVVGWPANPQPSLELKQKCEGR
jgi:nitrous oxidase accessory protein NosD